MQRAIHLEPNMVPTSLRGAYNGRMFKAVVCETMTIPADAGLWSGGSRNVFGAIDFATGGQRALHGQNRAPWDGGRREYTVTLEPGYCVVEHSFFCGKDMGLTFYVHPANAAALLPAPAAELSPVEKLVLTYTATRKSSYNGRDRYEMAIDDAQCGYGENREKLTPSRDQWDTAKASLIAKGLLNKAGAITPAGRNQAR